LIFVSSMMARNVSFTFGMSSSLMPGISTPCLFVRKIWPSPNSSAISTILAMPFAETRPPGMRIRLAVSARTLL